MPSPETPPAITAELLEAMRMVARCAQSDWNRKRKGQADGPYEAGERVFAFCDAMLPIIPHDDDPF